MRQQGTIELFHYWDRLRDGRPAPRRTEIEPADIKSLLADTFILEKDSRGEAVFRLAGTRLCATFGRELKGFAFSSLWMQKDERVVARLVHGAFLAKSVIVINFDGVARSGRINPFELLLLPLDGGIDHPRTLGAVSPGARPFWLGADPIAECHITALRVVDPDREPMLLKNRPPVPMPPHLQAGSLLEPRMAPGLPPAGTGRRIRHLVVLDGGRDR